MSHGDDGEAGGSSATLPLVQAMLDHLDEGIMLADAQDRICLWNRAYLDMLDLPERLFTPGAPLLPLIRMLADRGDYGPGDPALLAEGIATNIRNRVSAQGEVQMTNGRIISVEWIPIIDGHFLFRLRDVTAERNASRFKDELIATVSHELRTPLTAIIGALGLLKGGAAGQADPRAIELIDVAQKNGTRLTALVNDLLDVDRLQAGALDFHFEPTDMAAFLASAVEQNRPYAQSLGVTIELETPPEPVEAEIDRARVQQVMSNLLSNAAKFSGSGSPVRVQLRPTGNGVRISVIDRGRGMSAEFRLRLFTRFAQENRNAENGQIGTGLGLSICKNIVDRHHGQIHVDTREGAGTIFHVDLPRRQGAAASSD